MLFKTTVVFQANYDSTAKVVVNQGGTSSSKTYSIMQVLYLKALQRARTRITVTGESINNLKKGAYRDAQSIFSTHDWLNQYVESWNKSDRVIYFKNGSYIEFISNIDAQAAKNGKRDYLFVNEANGIEWLMFWELMIRTTTQTILDYNPTARFWAHDNLIGTEGCQLIISDHRHNCFLTEEEHRKIENIQDKQLWLVYARGLTGNISGVIFPNWTRIPDSQFPKDAPIFGGLDFGYTNDPTCGVKLARVGESIFVKELCYAPGISPTQLKQLFEANDFNGGTPLYCENDPNMISQLRRLGVLALSARKGQGTVNAGIDKLKEYRVFYTESSKNLAEEIPRYIWISDPSSGKHTNTPIDKWNHAIDAIRYGVYTHFFRAA